MLSLYNSLSRKKELFTPLIPQKIGLYACGITVYDHCHLGHARSMVCFDMMVRFLKHASYDVTYVRNITDIDDKIIVRAHEKSIPFYELTSHYIDSMHQDEGALNIMPPDFEPRATDHIDEIINLIQRLIDLGFAYSLENGDVCYEVARFPEYGKLSQQDIHALHSRDDLAHGKRSPIDFVLWKMAKPNEPHWPSPWGIGRPGWHIECSAMAMKELGQQFDIHGGGLDLQFPHHENEIAQSEAASGHPFANYWLHVGMLLINDEKMSKSTGNFLTIKDALAKHHPETIRYFLLSSHYRSPLNYSDETMHNASKALNRLYQSLKEVPPSDEPTSLDEHWMQSFEDAMNDDFNTPVALSVLFQLSHEVNKTKSQALAATLKKLAEILGLLQTSPEEFLQAGFDKENVQAILELIEQRNDARKERNFAKADEVREQLLAEGIELEDGPSGTTWRRK